MTRGLIALTGASGFLGRRMIPALNSAGWRVRAFARNAAQNLADVSETVVGDLGDEAALARLTSEVDGVIHAAGLIKARNKETFFDVNAGGVHRLAASCPGKRLVLVSSLAAREPTLSDYAASKRAGEETARALSGSKLTVVRPPAIYGAGDRESLVLFKAAAGPVMPVPGATHARLAVAEVDDVAAIIVNLLDQGPQDVTIGGDCPAGYSWRQLAAAASEAVGSNPLIYGVPPWAMLAAGRLSALAGRGGATPPIFTPGKARESLHADWSVSDLEQGSSAGYSYIPLQTGFARAVGWYRQAGWLPSSKAREKRSI